jgi:hypothetical protein
MIIYLKGADFSKHNIGTLDSWRISRSLGSGATYEGPTSVDKGAAFSATVTLAEGYEIGIAGVTVTMGGTVLSGAHAVEGNVITITIAEVTGNVLIKVPTINTNTGEEDDPVTPDTPDEPPIGTYTIDLSDSSYRWTNGYVNTSLNTVSSNTVRTADVSESLFLPAGTTISTNIDAPTDACLIEKMITKTVAQNEKGGFDNGSCLLAGSGTYDGSIKTLTVEEPTIIRVTMDRSPEHIPNNPYLKCTLPNPLEQLPSGVEDVTNQVTWTKPEHAKTISGGQGLSGVFIAKAGKMVDHNIYWTIGHGLTITNRQGDYLVLENISGSSGAAILARNSTLPTNYTTTVQGVLLTGGGYTEQSKYVYQLATNNEQLLISTCREVHGTNSERISIWPKAIYEANN